MKYLGGKYMIGKHISKVILDATKNIPNDGYMEPFCGALGVLVHMTSQFDHVSATDLHPDLILMWQKVKNDTFQPPKIMSETQFKIIKQYKSPDATKAFVGFGCSFGGKFFGGYAQKYTNGKKEDFLKEATNPIKKIMPKIQNVDFQCTDYQLLKPKNMIIYCDPPYVSGKHPVKYRTSTKKYIELFYYYFLCLVLVLSF